MTDDVINVEIVITMPIPRSGLLEGYNEDNVVEAIINDFREITSDLVAGGLPVEISGRLL